VARPGTSAHMPMQQWQRQQHPAVSRQTASREATGGRAMRQQRRVVPLRQGGRGGARARARTVVVHAQHAAPADAVVVRALRLPRLHARGRPYGPAAHDQHYGPAAHGAWSHLLCSRRRPVRSRRTAPTQRAARPRAARTGCAAAEMRRTALEQVGAVRSAAPAQRLRPPDRAGRRARAAGLPRGRRASHLRQNRGRPEPARRSCGRYDAYSSRSSSAAASCAAAAHPSERARGGVRAPGRRPLQDCRSLQRLGAPCEAQPRPRRRLRPMRYGAQCTAGARFSGRACQRPARARRRREGAARLPTGGRGPQQAHCDPAPGTHTHRRQAQAEQQHQCERPRRPAADASGGAPRRCQRGASRAARAPGPPAPLQSTPTAAAPPVGPRATPLTAGRTPCAGSPKESALCGPAGSRNRWP